jgi:hypothetical protein
MRPAAGGANSLVGSGAKRAVHGVLVKVLTHRRDDRGMSLEPYASRCVRRGEVHELVTSGPPQRERASTGSVSSALSRSTPRG